jgi:N-acetylglucosaminyldiphosphoundecaprenol N-acetyl-beta-D-mannosaminyltransferase
VTISRVNILGVGVSAVNIPAVLKTIEGWVEQREPHYVCVSPVHSIMESHRDEHLRRIHNAAGLVTPDGMPLVWLSRIMGFREVEQVCGSDLLLAVCQHFTPQGYRHFFYGGTPDVLKQLLEQLLSRFPTLQIAGTYAPPFRSLTSAEAAAVVERINQVKPDIVWVGLGAPKQERWMADHVGRLHTSVLIGVGAAFDFHAGTKKRAPRWMQRCGLEWLFRLLMEPRRLWQRYLINNPWFLWLLLCQALGRKSVPMM